MSNLEELLSEFKKGAKIRQPSWNKNEYIYLSQNGIIYDERNKPFDFTNEELLADWEFYQEPYDWGFIIERKCLCWFWDDCFGCAAIGLLKKVGTDFFTWQDEDGNTACFNHCRPIRKFEINLYEDLQK